MSEGVSITYLITNRTCFSSESHLAVDVRPTHTLADLTVDIGHYVIGLKDKTGANKYISILFVW